MTAIIAKFELAARRINIFDPHGKALNRCMTIVISDEMNFTFRVYQKKGINESRFDAARRGIAAGFVERESKLKSILRKKHRNKPDRSSKAAVHLEETFSRLYAIPKSSR